MAIDPIFDGLEHAARMLNIPKDARICRAVVETEAVKPVRVHFTPVVLPAGVVLVPPVGH